MESKFSFEPAIIMQSGLSMHKIMFELQKYGIKYSSAILKNILIRA